MPWGSVLGPGPTALAFAKETATASPLVGGEVLATPPSWVEASESQLRCRRPPEIPMPTDMSHQTSGPAFPAPDITRHLVETTLSMDLIAKWRRSVIAANAPGPEAPPLVRVQP